MAPVTEDTASNRLKLAHRKGPGARTLMSALGHKQTFAMQTGMSALLPKADMCSATRDVRFGPIADTCTGIDNVRFTRKRTLIDASGTKEAASVGGL